MGGQDCNHVHGPGCGHTAVQHGDHVDYLHDGHLHNPCASHVHEHVLEVCAERPDGCTQAAPGHGAAHVHGPGCGHEPIPHGDHVDYLVEGRLHHPCAGHCDDHGTVATA